VLFVRAAAALAFGIAMLVSVRASAAIVPACEHDAVTRLPTVHLESSCNAAADADYASDSGFAPMCGEQGISAVAPPRLHPIADARIEAGSACSSIDVGQTICPRGTDPSLVQSPAVTDHGMLGAVVLVQPAPFLEMIDPTEPTGGPLSGFGNGVYHPPR
jgi:hypothetical protein